SGPYVEVGEEVERAPHDRGPHRVQPAPHGRVRGQVAQAQLLEGLAEVQAVPAQGRGEEDEIAAGVSAQVRRDLRVDRVEGGQQRAGDGDRVRGGPAGGPDRGARGERDARPGGKRELRVEDDDPRPRGPQDGQRARERTPPRGRRGGGRGSQRR